MAGRINWVPDLMAPLTVTAVDLVVGTAAPNYDEWASYGMTALGYACAWMGWGGDYMKNIGIASMPLTARKIYERVRGGTSSRAPTRKLALRRVSRYPAPATEGQFQGTRLV